MDPIGGLGSHGDVGVPLLAGRADGLLVGVDRHDLGMAVHAGVVGVGDEVAETGAEVLVALDRDVLVVEEEDAVGHEGVPDRAELGAADPAEVDSVHFGSDHGCNGFDGKVGPAHAGNIQAESGYGNGAQGRVAGDDNLCNP